jgi:hypothetical protein
MQKSNRSISQSKLILSRLGVEALWKLRLEGQEFEASLGCIVRFISKTKTEPKTYSQTLDSLKHRHLDFKVILQHTNKPFHALVLNSFFCSGSEYLKLSSPVGLLIN